MLKKLVLMYNQKRKVQINNILNKLKIFNRLKLPLKLILLDNVN